MSAHPDEGFDLKLNLGCGADYRYGWVNIDADPSVKADERSDLSDPSWAERWKAGTVSRIEASDLLEHMHHWEGIRLLQACWVLLESGGKIIIRTPDLDAVCAMSSTAKRTGLLYGGQDVPQGGPSDERRAKRPELFCHRYGYTAMSLYDELARAGFVNVNVKRDAINLVARAERV